MSRKSSLCVALALCAIGLLAASASAATIYIPNASFESPVLDDGGTTNGVSGPTDHWFSPQQNADPLSMDWYGLFNPKDAKFTNATDTSSTLGVPTGGDGRQVAILLSSPGRPNELQTYAKVGTIYEGDYTLTAAVGYESGYQASNAQLVLGTLDQTGAFVDLVRTPFAASSVPGGSFADISTSVTVSAGNALLGKDLYIRLACTSEGLGSVAATGAAGEVCFDNVRLTAPTPEPSTLAILASGLIGLVCYAWRKRK